MSAMTEIVMFGGVTIFSAWVVFLGGAEWLEGTVKSAFVLQADSFLWHAAGIKVYVGLSWLGALLWLLLT